MDDLRKWSSQLVPKLAEREFERAAFEDGHQRSRALAALVTRSLGDAANIADVIVCMVKSSSLGRLLSWLKLLAHNRVMRITPHGGSNPSRRTI